MPRKHRLARKSGDTVTIPPITHNALKAHILEYLTRRGVLAWGNSTGAYHPDGDPARFVRFGKKGSGDILGILPGGRFLSIEVKSKRDTLRPAQVDWMERVKAAGGIAIEARCVEDVYKLFEYNPLISGAGTEER